MKKFYFILSLLFCISLASLGQTSTIADSDPNAQVKFIKTYPNPATTVVNIEFQKGYSRTYSIQILNTLGKKMYLAKFVPSSFAIDLRAEKFYRGVYIYQLLDKTGRIVESGKILVVN